MSGPKGGWCSPTFGSLRLASLTGGLCADVAPAGGKEALVLAGGRGRNKNKGAPENLSQVPPCVLCAGLPLPSVLL